MQPVGGQAGQAEDQQHEDHGAVDALARHAVQRQRHGHHAEGQQRIAHAVEALDGEAVAHGHEAQGSGQADQAHGHVDQEDPVPAHVLHHPAAQRGADQRPDQAGNGHEAHGLEELLARKGAQHGQPAHGHEQRPAHALQHACGHHQLQVGSNRAQHRSQHEQRNRPQVDAPRAEAVGHPARCRDQHGHGQRIGDDDGLHAQRALAQGLGHGGQRGIDDGAVQRLHEKADGHEP